MRGRNIFSLFFFFLFGGEGTQCAARILLQPCLSLCLHLLVDTFGGKPSYLPPPPPPMSPLCCTPNVWAAYLACCQVMCAGLHALAVWPSTGSVLGSSRKKTWVAEKSVAVHSKKFLKTSSVCERPGAEGLWWGGRGVSGGSWSKEKLVVCAKLVHDEPHQPFLFCLSGVLSDVTLWVIKF